MVMKPESLCLLCFLQFFPQEWYLLNCKFIPDIPKPVSPWRFSTDVRCLLTMFKLFLFRALWRSWQIKKATSLSNLVERTIFKTSFTSFPQDKNGILKLVIDWGRGMRKLSLLLIRDAPQLPLSLYLPVLSLRRLSLSNLSRVLFTLSEARADT